jgi:hypothetical protein
LGEIGSHFKGIGPSAVSQNTRRLEERLKGDAKLSEKVHQLKRILSEQCRLTPVRASVLF